LKDLVDCSVTVRAVGRSSITYDFEMRNEGEVCMRAEVVAVLLDDDGRPQTWPGEYRALLLGAGPQPPEKLTVG
jgi:acyl-CoA thioesterase FadM